MKILSINIDYINDSKKSIDRLSLENLFLKYFTVRVGARGEEKDARSSSESVGGAEVDKAVKPEPSTIKEVEKIEPFKARRSIPKEVSEERQISAAPKAEESKSLETKDLKEVLRKVLNDLERGKTRV